METTARVVMQTRFHVLHPDNTVREAVNLFKKAERELERKIFGMLVTDSCDKLVGMLSMYDIFLFLRPKHIAVWGQMEDIDLTGYLDEALERAKAILVDDIMSRDVIAITPETSLMMVVDIMINKHVRRLPVLEGQKIVGIVYISDVFDYLLERFLN